MAKLVIVESPAKAKTIGKYLGDDYEVTASMGHIRDLPASQLGIDVEHGYAPQYISIKGKEKLIKELASRSRMIMLRMPCLCSSTAAARPAGPPPIITTSFCSIAQFSSFRILPVSTHEP